MRISRNLFGIIAAIFILIALIGPLDNKSTSFIKESTEKTIKFQALIAEVKMVLSGLSKIDIPFINGHSDELTKSLDDANQYLLKVSVVVFSQLMLATISQSWVFKILLILLFITFLWRKNSMLSAKFLIILLAINPGLSIYTNGVSYLSQQSAIDFGEKYLVKLETQVENLKNEKSELMAKHEQQRTQERNGERHVNVFGKLKEDISYDFKKVGDDLKGDFLQIRLLIKEAGHEMTIKVYNFCTMILFCFLLLPIGYLIIIYTIYRSSFGTMAVLVKDAKELAGDVTNQVEHLTIFEKTGNALKAAWNELKAEPGKIVHAIENKVESADTAVHEEIKNIRDEFKNELQTIKNELKARVKGAEKTVESKVITDTEKLKSEVKTDVDGVENELANQLKSDKTKLTDKVEAEVDKVESNLDRDVHNVISKGKGKIDTVEQDLKAGVKEKEQQVKSEIAGEVKNVESAIKEKVDNEENDVADKVSQVKANISEGVNEEEEKIESTLDQAKADTEKRIEKTEDDINADADKVEEAVEQKVKSLKADADQLKKDVKQLGKDKKDDDDSKPLISI